MGARRKIFYYTLLIFILSITTLALSEAILRIIPGPWKATSHWIIDPEVGPWSKSNYIGEFKGADFHVKNIHWNQFGMRDKPRELEKRHGKKRIAVLGDSFMEGLQVGDEKIFSRQLEVLLGPNWEVLNFGKSSIGTCGEYLVYLKKAKHFNPDIVILAFLPGNDIRNNSIELESAYRGRKEDLPYAFFVRDSISGEYVLQPPKPPQKSFRSFLKKYFYSYRFWRFFRDRWLPSYMKRKKEGREDSNSSDLSLDPSEMSTNLLPYDGYWTDYGVYCPINTIEWRNAWETTEWCLTQLVKEVKKDSSKFLLVTIPSAIDTAKSKLLLEKESNQKTPPGFWWDRPTTIMKKFASKLDIPIYDLAPGMREYAKNNDLKFPWFSWEHDAHWNELGHKVAAQLVYDYLKSSGLLRDSIPHQ